MEGGRVNFIPNFKEKFYRTSWNTFAQTPRIV